MMDDLFTVLLKRIKGWCSLETIPHKEILALAAISGPDEIDALIRELDALDDADLVNDAGDISDEYWRLRISLAGTLEKIGLPAVVPLLQALNSPNPQTRAYCALALGEIGDSRAFEPICKLLACEKEKWPFIEALGDLKDARAVEVLLPYLTLPLSQSNRRHIVRSTAIALGKIGTEQTIQPLINVLKADKEWYARMGAVEGLSYIQNQGASEALRDALNDPDEHVKDNARQALSKLEQG